MIDRGRADTQRAIREAGGDEDTDYINEELILEYMGEASEVTKADLDEHAGRLATADDVPQGAHPEDFYVIYGWNVFFVGSYVYFQIVSAANACTSYKRRMLNPAARIVGTASCGRTKYQLSGWNAPKPV